MARQSVSNMVESEAFVEELANQTDELTQLVESMGSERRYEERQRLDSPYMMALEGPDSKPSACRLLDLGLRGIRVEFQSGADAIPAQSMVRLRADKAPLAEVLRGASGQVIWRDGILCGIELEKPLMPRLEDLMILVAKFHRG
jgi:hypothetical protein